MQRIALVAKKGSEAANRLAAEVKERCASLEVRAERQLAEALGWELPDSDAAVVQSADLVIVLGGDGTLLHAARLLGGRPTPLLGVNLGSLGFMTEIPAADLFATLDQVLAGRFRVDSRMKLACRLFREGEVVLEDEALNDVVINKGALARIADHEMSIEGEYVTTYKSDGVVIATPTGSTAYSLSAGGPIVHPRIEAVIVSPICSHALTQRPIVAPSDRVIRIVLHSEVPDIYLTIDGQSGTPLKGGDCMEIERSRNKVHLVRNRDLGYFGILREKLKWGER